MKIFAWIKSQWLTIAGEVVFLVVAVIGYKLTKRDNVTGRRNDI
jgi:hypothetical protein